MYIAKGDAVVVLPNLSSYLQLDPWDPSILRYVSSRPQPRCQSRQPPRLLYTRASILHVNMTSLAWAGYSDIRELVCSLRYISLVDSEHYYLGPPHYISLQRTGDT